MTAFVMSNKQIININKIIAKVLSGEASAEEIMLFCEWVNESEENIQEFQILSDFWEIKTEKGSFLAEISFENNIANRLSQKTEDKPSKGFNFRKRNLFVLSIAASFLLVLLSTATYWLLQEEPAEEFYIYVSQDDISCFTLPDSSRITLSKNSKLSYSSNFSLKDRKVILEGEAYFEVSKQEDSRFIVQVGDSYVEVLGTKFNVNGVSADERIVTTLVEGSVLFRNETQRILMTPNQQLTYHPKTDQLKNIPVDVSADIAWKDRLNQYSSISLLQLIDLLELQYDIEIELKDHLRDTNVSGTFLQEQSLEEVLTVMQRSIGFRWTKENNKIIIH